MRTNEQIQTDAQPFAPSVISQLPGQGNRTYVGWVHYAQRLLMTHGAHRYTVTNMTHGPSQNQRGEEEHQWAVTVRVQFSDDEWYDAVGQGDTPTAAESNAYKRACAHAGIGLHLYGDYWLLSALENKYAAPAADQPVGEGAGV